MTPEIKWAAFGALLSTLVGYAINGFSVSSNLSWIILVCIILAMVLILITIGPIPLLFSSSRDINLTGRWQGNWSFKNSSGSEIVVTEEVRFSQHGRLILGEAKSTKIEGIGFVHSGTHYKMQGKVEHDGTISGRWWNVIPGRRYHGYFQGSLSRAGKQLSGRWVGLDDGRINGGEFTWTAI